MLASKSDLEELNYDEWLFDWKSQIISPERNVYKLVIKGNIEIIQGMISISDRADHIYVNLIESANFNKGKNTNKSEIMSPISFKTSPFFDC